MSRCEHRGSRQRRDPEQRPWGRSVVGASRWPRDEGDGFETWKRGHQALESGVRSFMFYYVMGRFIFLKGHFGHCVGNELQGHALRIEARAKWVATLDELGW